MNALGNLARCRPAASGANLALATELGLQARVLLDQLLQPLACELRYQLIGAAAIE
jgi:hypothetical protein